MANENGVTISLALVAKGLGGMIVALALGAIFYVASAIPKIQTDIAVISQSLSDTKKTDEKQWEYLGNLTERINQTREYLAEKGWTNEKHK